MPIEPALILIADDNETARYGKMRILRRAGFEVIEAADGTRALELVAARKPRLVVLDVQMPGIDGWEVCRRIKGDAETASVLVLQISATYVREEDTVRALEGGADACLTEPVEAPVLVATVKALLRARQAEDALREALDRERAARAAAEAANRTKDEFLATLSHELRSPLSAMLNWVVLLRTAQVDPDQTARALEAIERNTRLQAKLVDDLLDVSRIIAGKMVLEVRLIDLAPIVGAALDSVRPAAEAKGIHVAAEVDAAIGLVAADAGRLQQVVWNLLSNAVKFTPKGGRVDLRARMAGSQIEIRVTDTGQGIEPVFLPHLFERFRQADSSTSRSEGGLGLGLAIVRHLVELHGGSVDTEIEGRERGASFCVRLPVPALAARAAGARSDSPSDRRIPSVALPRIDGVRVLVVDDERDAREAIVAVLDVAGARTHSVASAAEALAVLRDHAVDVLLSDIAMPIEDGFRLIREVRAGRIPDKRSIHAIALTAYAGTAEQGRILDAGYDGSLAKPVEPLELVDAVARGAKGS